MKKPKVLIALSGGVDSSVAAILLKSQGYQLIGVTLNVFDSDNFGKNSFLQAINDATMLASKLQIPYFVIDVRKDFKKQIINEFVLEYTKGKTPNPCALCNYQIKWEKLLELADEFDCKYIATGHYARVNQLDNRYFISVPEDETKDQTFFLWRLKQEQIKRTIFPLGNFKKSEIKSIAKSAGWETLAKKRESYNICFIPDGDYRAFINSFLNRDELDSQVGEFLDENRKVLGKHTGIWNYTIGQRLKEISILSNPAYVTGFDVEKRHVFVGNCDKLIKNKVVLYPFNLSKHLVLSTTLILEAKYRYKIPPAKCTIQQEGNKLIIQFLNPVSALAPGQSIVIYEGNDILGGGVILQSL
jgi:tRNA-specific 2-thiouridylase